MKSLVLKDAQQYLYRLGSGLELTEDPNELLRELVRENEALYDQNKKLSEKLVDRAAGIEPDAQLPLGAVVA